MVARSLGSARVSAASSLASSASRASPASPASPATSGVILLCFPNVSGRWFRARVAESLAARLHGQKMPGSTFLVSLVSPVFCLKCSLLWAGLWPGSGVSVLSSGFCVRCRVLLSGFRFLLFCLRVPVFCLVSVAGCFQTIGSFVGLRGPDW